MISRSFGCDTPPGFRLMTKACSTSGWSRHSIRTPSPTMPVAPVMIALIFTTLVFADTGPPRARTDLPLSQYTRIIDQSEAIHDERAIHPLCLVGCHGAVRGIS